MNVFQLQREDITDLERAVIYNGKINIFPAELYKSYGLNKTMLLMLKYGIYVLPTAELIQWLRENIVGAAIEIGCGNGAIGRALEIPFSDNRMQERPEIAALYKMIMQPTIKYPADVETLDAMDAIEKYQPNTVIGAFITHRWNGISGNPMGVDTRRIIESGVKYMMIGNINTHRDNPDMNLSHSEYSFDWLINRVSDQSLNRIFVWNG